MLSFIKRSFELMFQVFQPSRSLPISRLTIFLSLFIVISASFMRQAMDICKVYIGKKGFAILVGVALILAAVFFLNFLIRKKMKLKRKLLVFLLLAGGLILSWQIKLPQERIHILEYAVLGWFFSRDLRVVDKNKRNFIFVCLFCVVVGIVDELFQAILPYRVFDTRDILFNGLGGVFGGLLYIRT